MHILIAPNAFKNSLSANEAAIAIQTGLQDSRLDCSTECFAVGDGGDGTAALIIEKCNGVYVPVMVEDPLGRPIHTTYGLIDNGFTAIIEMANASGLRLVQPGELNPLRTRSVGTGEMIKDAMNKGVRKMIIGMGGSATVDGGTGILQALGIKFLDAAGKSLTNLPESLVDLADIDISELDARFFGIEVIVLCDVNNPLLGPSGAAAVFGPQKGASPADVLKLEKALQQFCKIVFNKIGSNIEDFKSGGTAGGAAAGLFAFLRAKLVNGIDYFLELTDFETQLSQADVVITGEGSIDEQTLDGKGPYGVAAKAKLKDVNVIGLAGMIPQSPSNELRLYFDVLLAIGHKPASLPEAIAGTRESLIRIGHTIGNLLSFDLHNNKQEI